jgi:hypothetical protein
MDSARQHRRPRVDATVFEAAGVRPARRKTINLVSHAAHALLLQRSPHKK